MYHLYQDSLGERLRCDKEVSNSYYQEGYNSNGKKNPYAPSSISHQYFQMGVLHKEIEALSPIEM